MALVAGEETLYTGGPLNGETALRWLASRPHGPVYVGYFFDYDCTMLLRDIADDDKELAAAIFDRSKRKSRLVWWRDIGIDYLPRKHLVVKVEGKPAITIHDVRGFFQCSFLDALKKWGIGTEQERSHIGRMKAERSTFDPAKAQEIISYCQDECRLLADLLGDLKKRFVSSGLNPYPYEGPGPVAGKKLTAELGGKASEYDVPPEVYKFAQHAYYGGRFEVAAHGRIHEPVWEYDINSAYPHAMTLLPCLIHGEWIKDTKPRSDLWLGYVEWNTGPLGDGEYGPLPFRYDSFKIKFPTTGRGWYWSVEAGPYADPVGDVFSYIKRCQCQPFRWVEEAYYKRKAMDRESPGAGLPLKLTLNSLYGKLCQRIGKRPHYQPVWASLITAYTRAKIYSIHKLLPGTVAMFATDAVFTTQPLSDILSISDQLGAWSAEGPFEDFFILQPGVYFDGNEAIMKTRGVPKRVLKDHVQEIRNLPLAIFDDDPVAFSASQYAKVELPMTNHLGMRQALHWNTTWYERIGDWIDQPRKVSLWNAMNKRDGMAIKRRDSGTLWSPPLEGNSNDVTIPYDDSEAQGEEMHLVDELWTDGLYDG